jgi:hypothetical protein
MGPLVETPLVVVVVVDPLVAEPLAVDNLVDFLSDL